VPNILNACTISMSIKPTKITVARKVEAMEGSLRNCGFDELCVVRLGPTSFYLRHQSMGLNPSNPHMLLSLIFSNFSSRGGYKL
jgi:hypothetical protein